ncbi:tRNA (N6-threonylcarbamoyladenosine(37)-N6)-methyltransferase TrmO [Desulfococcaceae bacterium HSG8]|nr:tRNA (N6-threonylcarbamoyladenosine(37)-N6)-methyltransferase TrmO [Desulfococcaceae bacterium HSG8]
MSVKNEMILRPVGVVESKIREPVPKPASDDPKEFAERRKKANEMRKKTARIIIDKDMEGILDGIEDFSHILLLYWPHLIPDEKRRTSVRVHPMGRKEFPLVGIFATCSPMRPNPVLTTMVRLLKREGNVLEVTGLDAVDGSPVIDVKPFHPWFYPLEDVRLPDWMEQMRKEFSSDEKSS